MTDVLPVGTEVSHAETFRCVNCGYEIDSLSIERLPECPDCRGSLGWEKLGGEDGGQPATPSDVLEERTASDRGSG